MDENSSSKRPKEEEEKEGDAIVTGDEPISKKLRSDDGSIVGDDQSRQLETLADAEEELSDVKPLVIATPVASVAPPGFQIEKFGMARQEALARVTAQVQVQMQVSSYSSSELLPVPIEQSLFSSITPYSPCQKSPTLHQDNIVCLPEVNHEIYTEQKLELPHMLAKPLSPDGYNWRKYGQKPVKYNDSSRSYYRCTHTDCHVKKKVERCDHSGRVAEIIYKGLHNHDPPQKVRCPKPKRCSSTVGTTSPDPGEESGTIDCPPREVNNSDPSASSEKFGSPSSPRVCSSDAIVKSEENCEQIRAKQRTKGQGGACSDSSCKIVNKPKVVVQTSDDVGISGDGYRWRKYGQKMVKGNSNPRSYYKCTYAGCPVRKHVERATDDTPTMMITYEGKHIHNMPVPKKYQDPPSASLILATATTMNNAQPVESESLVDPNSSTQRSLDEEREVKNEKTSEFGGAKEVTNEKASEFGEVTDEKTSKFEDAREATNVNTSEIEGIREVTNDKTSEFGGEKALESARTLLSIGIELRPC